MRHSFISYRLAVVQDANQLALESGNSPAMIHKHYKQPVSPAAGKKWFAMRPESKPPQITPEVTLHETKVAA